MGYQRSKTDKSAPLPVQLEVAENPDEFVLLTPFVYVDQSGTCHEVPRQTTDLTSVPAPLRGLIGSYGRHLCAALLHDYECGLAKAETDRKAGYAARRRADATFREALRDRGDGSPQAAKKRVSWFRTQLLWTGVSLGRYWEFRRARLLLLFTPQALTGMAGVFLALGRRDPRWLALYALALVVATAWGPDRGVVLVGVAVAPIVVPAFVLNLVAALILTVPDIVPKLLHPASEPAPDPKPTMKLV